MKLSLLFVLIMAWAATSLAEPLLWGPRGVALSGNGHVEWDRAAACDAAGNATVVWSDIRNRNRDVYAQFITLEGSLPWGNGVQITDNPFEQSNAQVAATDGGWIVAWIDYRNVPRGDPNYGDFGGEVWLQKLDNQGNPLWTAGGVRVDSSTYVARGSLRLLSDDAGGALLKWLGRPASTTQTYVRGITAGGLAAWPLVSVSTYSMYPVAVATDNSGGMVLVWVDNYTLHATRIDASGAQPYGTLTVRDTVSYYDPAVVAADGSGGCYVGWLQRVSNNNLDVRAQHLTATGQFLWEADGLPVCQSPASQNQLLMTTSINGGVPDGCLLTWCDNRSPNFSAARYAQKLSADGTLLWAANGTLVCDTASYEQTVNPVSDGEGGLVAAWDYWVGTAYDGRSIKATRLNASGAPAWPQGRVWVCDALDDDSQADVLPQPDGFLTVFETAMYGAPVQGMKVQKLNRSTGARMLTDVGISLVSTPSLAAGGQGMPVSMSGGRTAMVWNVDDSTRFQILSSTGQPTLNLDTVAILPDTTGTPFSLFTPYFYTNEAFPDAMGGFFYLQGWGNDEYGYEAFLGHVSAEGHSMGNNGKAGWIWEGADVSDWGNVATLLSPDSAGGCYVLFQDYFPRDGKYLMRMNSACQRLWSTPVQLDTSVQYEANEKKLITAADGSCIAAWPDESGRYKLARINPEGLLLWTISFSDSGAFWDMLHPELTTDGQDGAYCTWVQSLPPPDYYRVYAQHFMPDGTEAWSHGGIPITLSTSDQTQSHPTHDTAGNLIVVCESYSQNAVSSNDIVAQKISADGDRLWSDSGRVVCGAPGSQINPAVIPDDDDGLFVAWEDDNDGNSKSHISATHLNSDGFSGPDPYWVQNAGGLISDTAANANVSPMIIPGGAGSAIVLWSQDFGQSDPPATYDRHAQRIVPNTLAARNNSEALPARYALRQNYPNPFNPATLISFELGKAGISKLTVYDLLGRRVATLVNQHLAAGEHQILFDASRLASGIYFYRLESGTYISSRKMVLLK